VSKVSLGFRLLELTTLESGTADIFCVVSWSISGADTSSSEVKSLINGSEEQLVLCVLQNDSIESNKYDVPI
jgi:hypothetical protein